MRANDDPCWNDFFLDYFDNEAVRTQFNRLTGSMLTQDHRPLIGRFLAEYQPKPGWKKPGNPDEADAWRFLWYIHNLVWLRLIAFIREGCNALEEPEHFARLRDEFEATLKRDGLWNKQIMDMTYSYFDEVTSLQDKPPASGGTWAGFRIDHASADAPARLGMPGCKREGANPYGSPPICIHLHNTHGIFC